MSWWQPWRRCAPPVDLFLALYYDDGATLGDRRGGRSLACWGTLAWAATPSSQRKGNESVAVGCRVASSPHAIRAALPICDAMTSPVPSTCRRRASSRAPRRCRAPARRSDRLHRTHAPDAVNGAHTKQKEEKGRQFAASPALAARAGVGFSASDDRWSVTRTRGDHAARRGAACSSE